MGEFVNLENDIESGVATIRIERPPMNAISMQLASELREIAEELSSNQDIGAVVVWGGPKIFAAGADIKEFVNFSLLNKPQTIKSVLCDFKVLVDVVKLIRLCIFFNSPLIKMIYYS